MHEALNERTDMRLRTAYRVGRPSFLPRGVAARVYDHPASLGRWCAADLARYVTALFQGMTVQAINAASREDLLRLSGTALRIWPK